MKQPYNGVMTDFQELRKMYGPQVRLPTTGIELKVSDIYPVIKQEGTGTEIKSYEKGFGGKYVRTYSVPRPESKSLEVLMLAMAEGMAFYKTFDPRSRNPTADVDALIDNYLKSHGKPPFKDFLSGTNASAIYENDFGSLANASLKKSLLEFRAKLYLIALATAEGQGYGQEQLLDELGKSVVPPIKKEPEEPAFRIVRARLRS